MNDKKRQLVIGDIHGRHQKLKYVLLKCNYNQENDTIIFLGDYIDGCRGGLIQQTQCNKLVIDAKKTIDTIINIVLNRICLLGNHDKWLREFIRTKKIDKNWLSQGGYGTLNSYGIL
jgi:serine/threonine protein phosphatase 1